MGILRESWCFCKGGSKTERVKVTICSGKGQSMVRISGIANGVSGTGFLIHRNLLLTTHANLPSVVAAESSEIRLQNGVAASLVPHRFFVTSSVLDLTIVGYTAKQELTIGEGKVVIGTDNLIKLSTDGVIWSPGSAGFDVHGNLAFMICDPMKLATSPNTKSSSTSSSSSSSWKKDHPMQFGIPIPVICDWLNQHWEGSLDELNKPKLPLIRLMSTGQKSEHSCASFSLRQRQGIRDLAVPTGANFVEEHALVTDPNATHLQGIPTPEIYESPRLTAVPLRKKERGQIQLLDINFPPRIAKPAVLPQSAKQLHQESDKNYVKESLPDKLLKEQEIKDRGLTSLIPDAETASTGSVNGGQSEVQSSSPIEVSELHDGYSSEGETMYSAETAESRNYKSPREVKFQQVGRSQSCVSYNRWGAVHRNPVAARRAMLEKQRSLIHGRKMYSQGATSQRSNEYFSPTVSSVMKKRNSLEQPNRPRQSPIHSSPRWMF
ncbi:Trypsin-like cysteine/serine peptidase domain-containing protein [Quillaja saponaria]|uniref:Trypsin-like cysteine/serine peptidase domain-containing protein n=1 Tax=Quillaja saponaria TaxID=32244 RepID=A0AAD7PCF5_QUISA|nr:Trypsin-like cysteine/serine peptidase domain-containing protein [Quillaja saponaria]